MIESAKHGDSPRVGEETEVQDPAAREVTQGLSLRSLQTPGAIPGYHIEQCLGEGSFGSVWLARELRTGKKVAIKFYARGRGVDWSLLSREVEKLAVLYTSRNIVRLIDVAWDHDPPYFVMEYLENGSLAQKLERGRLPVDDAVRITRAMALALVHAHGSGVLHCDLKPANVLFDASGDARLCDFGQSRLSSERTPSLGTMFYMAPEQAVLDGIPDARWDVYALGALLYQMLTGTAPGRDSGNEGRLQRAGTTEERLAEYRRILQESPPLSAHRAIPGVDQRLIQIVDRCLNRDPQGRIANTQIVVNLLDQRDRARSRRPLLVLALLGPLLFLAAMFWMAESAVPSIVRKAGDNLTSQALSGDVISARILAESVHQDILSRTEELEFEASEPHVRQIITDSVGLSSEQLIALCRENSSESGMAKNFQLLNEAKQHSAEHHDHADRSWFLTDANGRQVFRHPAVEDFGKSTIGGQFHRRDYFHGQGEDLKESTPIGAHPPRTKAGVSAAYTSMATDQYAIAIAVPVWDESKTHVIGVLGRSLHLTDLLDPWEKQLQGESRPDQRFLSLVESALKPTPGRELSLLDHHWMTPANMASRKSRMVSQLPLQSPESPPIDLRVYLSAEQALLVRNDDRTGHFKDPIAALDPQFEGDWLAAWAKVDGTNWIAVVQERRDVALKPVDDLRNVFSRSGYIAIAVFSVMLGVFWWLLRRVSE